MAYICMPIEILRILKGNDLLLFMELLTRASDYVDFDSDKPPNEIKFLVKMQDVCKSLNMSVQSFRTSLKNITNLEVNFEQPNRLLTDFQQTSNRLLTDLASPKGHLITVFQGYRYFKPNRLLTDFQQTSNRLLTDLQENEEKEKRTKKEKEDREYNIYTPPNNNIYNNNIYSKSDLVVPDDVSAELEEIWNKILTLYPQNKLRGRVTAKQKAFSRLMGVMPENLTTVLKLIGNGVALYVADYRHNNPDDENSKYMPSLDKWFDTECDYWLQVATNNSKVRKGITDA